MTIDRRTFLAAAPAVFALPAMPRLQTAQPTGMLNVLDYGAIGDGVANDLPAFLAALAAAQGSRAVGVYAPAGSYRLSNASGRVLDLTKAGLTIAGDGIGLTQLLLDDNVTITSHLRLFHLAGARQTVRDFSVIGGAGWAGTFDTSHIDIDTGALYWRAERVEMINVYGYGSAGGVGLSCYQNPASNGGAQFGHAEDCITRDSPKAGGFGTASNNNAFIRCAALRCGDSTNRHGFYIQGGATRFEQCYAEGNAGMSYHAHEQSSSLDASGNTFDGCVSVAPGLKHMIVDGYTTPGGQLLNRNATVRGCRFVGAAEGIDLRVPALIEGNTFEDVRKSGQTAITIGAGAQGSIVRGNYLKSSYGISAVVPATIESNSIDSTYGGVAIHAGAAGVVVQNNRIVVAGMTGASATGINLGASRTKALNNQITVTAPGTGIAILNNDNVESLGNDITALNGAWWQSAPSGNSSAKINNTLR